MTTHLGRDAVWLLRELGIYIPEPKRTGARRRLTDAQHEAAIKAHIAGETIEALADHYHVAAETMRKYVAGAKPRKFKKPRWRKQQSTVPRATVSTSQQLEIA